MAWVVRAARPGRGGRLTGDGGADPLEDLQGRPHAQRLLQRLGRGRASTYQLLDGPKLA